MKKIDNLVYRIFKHPDKTNFKYEGMAEFLEKNSVKEHILNTRCDTPVHYFLLNKEGEPIRQGFIPVKDFLIKGRCVRRTLIKNRLVSSEYLVPDDLAEWSLTVERNTHREENFTAEELQKEITKEEIEIPLLQLEINTEEFYVW